MSGFDVPEQWRVMADSIATWRNLSEYYDENPDKMWGEGGGLVDAYTGESISTDITEWRKEHLLEQFAHLKHSVYTYNAHPSVTADTRWSIGTLGTWFRFRFDNMWKLRQVRKEILRRME